MRKQATRKPGTQKVSTVKIDVKPKIQDDNSQKPTHYEENPGFAKFSTNKGKYKNVPVKFVKSEPGKSEKIEIKSVSIQIEPPVDVDHPTEYNKWGRYPGQAVLLDVTPKIPKDQPQRVQKWDRFPNGRGQLPSRATYIGWQNRK